jgi:hypothetical protein
VSDRERRDVARACHRFREIHLFHRAGVLDNQSAGKRVTAPKDPGASTVPPMRRSSSNTNKLRGECDREI